MTTTMPKLHKAARAYLGRGWCAIPVPARSKNPNRKGWERERYEPGDVAQTFPPDGNIGIQCGEPSNGLIDIDLDCVEARILAPEFLPSTGRIHGRASSPASHWWYVCDPIPDTTKYRDPDRTMLIELRSTGAQTIVPPSFHESGEEITWESTGEATEIDGRILQHQVSRLAACVLLARRWTKGSRHDLALAVSGALLRHDDWEAEGVADFIEAASRAAGDVDQINEHRQAVVDTYDALSSKEETTGIPTLSDLLGEKETRRFLDWLGLEYRPATINLSVPAEPKPTNGHVEQISELAWSMPADATPLDIDDLPYWLNRIVRHIEPYTPMFPSDWPIMMTLPFWSILWPHVHIQNLNLAIWTLGFGVKGSGKNVCTDELLRIVRHAGDRELILYTAGTPEGMWDALEGDGTRMIAYHDEYSGLLKLLTRDHMNHVREALCALYDGRDVGYIRARNRGVEIHDPLAAVAATTTPAAMRRWADPEDLANGYLSRFMMCAPNSIDHLPEYYPSAQSSERDTLIRELTQMRNENRGITRLEYEETGRPDPPIVNQYRDHLGINSGRKINLDEQMDDRSISGGRLLARMKKIAGLLALAERPIVTGDAGKTAYIKTGHIETAIAIVERDRFYFERVERWIGEAEDVELSNRIHALLRAHPSGLSRRDLCRKTKKRAGEVQDALRLLQDDGAALRTKPKDKRAGELWVAIYDRHEVTGSDAG